jgi:hypothetical protein
VHAQRNALNAEKARRRDTEAAASTAAALASSSQDETKNALHRLDTERSEWGW